MKKLPYNRVIIITLLVALLSMGLGLIVLSRIKRQLVGVSSTEYKKQQTLLTTQIADTLKSNLEHVENQLKLMATMPELKNVQNVDQCNSKLSELLLINQKQLGNLGRVDSSGRFVCSVNSTLIGQDSVRYGPYIQNLITDPKHMPVMGRITRPAGTDTIAAGLHVPVYDDGDNFIGTLGGALYFSKFQDQYLKSIKLGKNGFVVVMDDNGDILYHPSKMQSGKNLLSPEILAFFEPQATMRQLVEDVKSNKSGTFDYSVQGTKKVGIYKTIEVPNVTGRHWAILVTIPVEDLEEAVNSAGINRIMIILVLLLSFTTGLITFVSLRNTLKALEVQRMKDEFIAITSHQLRTPATIVKQYLGLLKGNYAKNKTDTTKFINAAYESNEDQLSIIENILSVSKIEAGRLEIQKEKLILQDLVQTVIASLNMNLTLKKHKLKIYMPKNLVHVNADPTKLTMAVENLISNAIKYTTERGKITISVTSVSGEAFIAIKDNGSGIPSKEIPKLFKRFNRLDAALDSHVPGTGLGLYLAKQIVELHGGSIAVESAQNRGSTFTIRLPVD